MSETFFRKAIRDDGETDVEVEIAVNSWGSPPHYGSPTYAGDPGDPMEVEITACWLVADEHRADAPRVTLTDAERERIETEFLEDPPEPHDPNDY